MVYVVWVVVSECWGSWIYDVCGLVGGVRIYGQKICVRIYGVCGLVGGVRVNC